MERGFDPPRDCKRGCNSLYAWRSEHGDSSNASVSNVSSECRISNVSSVDSQSLGVGVTQSTKVSGWQPSTGCSSTKRRYSKEDGGNFKVEGETCQPSTGTKQRYKEADRDTRGRSHVKVDLEGESCQTSTGCNSKEADRDTRGRGHCEGEGEAAEASISTYPGS